MTSSTFLKSAGCALLAVVTFLVVNAFLPPAYTSPQVAPSVERFQNLSEMELDGCQYFFATDTYGRYSVITHKGNCTNHAKTTCSWYGEDYEGKPTASGEIFVPSLLTASSRQHPLGARLRVTFEGHSVIVRVNDRPALRYADRLDLSRAAFQQLAPLERGVIQATVEVLP